MRNTSAFNKDLMIAGFIAVTGIIILCFNHPATRLAFILAMVIAYTCFCVYRHYEQLPANNFLPVYLLCIAIQCLHFAEEFVAGFYQRIPEINGFPAMTQNYFIIFNMVAYALFLLAAVGIYKKIKWVMVIAWFFIIAGVIGNSIWHLLMALRVGGYFPGLYTSFAYWIAAPFLLSRLTKPG